MFSAYDLMVSWNPILPAHDLLNQRLKLSMKVGMLAMSKESVRLID